MNCIGGVGMLGLSVGIVFLGDIQDGAMRSAIQLSIPSSVVASGIMTSGRQSKPNGRVI